MSLTFTQQYVGPAQSGGNPVTARQQVVVPHGAQSATCYCFNMTTRALVSCQVGFFDGSNDWLVTTSGTPTVGALAPFTNRLLYVQPNAAMTDGDQVLFGVVWQIP